MVVIGIIVAFLLAATIVSMWVLWGTYNDHDSVVEDYLSDILDSLQAIEKEMNSRG
jgi:hypothetical protein